MTQVEVLVSAIINSIKNNPDQWNIEKKQGRRSYLVMSNGKINFNVKGGYIGVIDNNEKWVYVEGDLNDKLVKAIKPRVLAYEKDLELKAQQAQDAIAANLLKLI